MTNAKQIPIRMSNDLLRLIKLLQQELGIDSRAGLVRHAIARLAMEHNVKLRGKNSAK